MLSAQAAEDRAEALTPVMRNHPPHGRQAHIRPGWTPDAADVRADVTQRRTQFPPEDVIAPDDDTNPARRPNASGPNASRRPPWTSWDSPPWP